MVATANPEIRKAVDLLYEISADEQIRAEYDARQKAWMDRESQFEGFLHKGRVEGRAEGRIETAVNLKALGVPTDIIVKSTGLSSEEIAKL
jgi:predicted transposase/invertase (TIGR01784 family)